MKRTIITIFLCGVIVLGITGCGTKNKFDVGEKSNIEITENNVSLSIKEGTLTNTGATLVLKNNSDITVSYGNPYSMEIKQNGQWHKIDVELNFTLPAYFLSSGESTEILLNWENAYGELAKGEYRIIKNIDVEKEDGLYEAFAVAAEFTIK